MRMQQARNFCLLAFFVVWRFSRGRIPNLAWASIQIKIAWSIQSWFWTSPIFARSILFQERKMLPFQAKFSLENSFKTFKQTNLWFFAVYVSSVLTRWIMQVSARPVFHWAYGYNRIACAGSFRADWVRPVATRNISFKKKCSIRPDLVARNWANLIEMSVSACVRRPLLGFVELRGLQTTTCASQATRQGRLRATSCQDTWRLWRDCWFSTTWPSTSSDAAFESRHSIGSEPGLCVPQKLVHSPNLVSSHVDQRWASSSTLWFV